MDIPKIKSDFPIFNRKFHDKDIVYLDNAATAQKPLVVIDAVSDFYKNHNANVHRGIHTLSEEASELYDSARKKVAAFIGAHYPEEITFTNGTTESLNRINYEWGVTNLTDKDVVLTTEGEHHSNLVPWQMLSQITGAALDFIELKDDGSLDIDSLRKKITPKVKFVAISHATNVSGEILLIDEICKMARQFGALVSVDGAQAVPHMEVNVNRLGCDFYSFSGHKMLGPTGIGVLWARKELLEKMEPYEYGGGMIKTVTREKADWAKLPEKFEAGTPNIAGAIGLGVAIDYIMGVGLSKIREHEIDMNTYALDKLNRVDGLRIIGSNDPKNRTGLVSFTLVDVHAHDIAAVLNSENVAVRSGHHCAMPLHKKLGIPASVRASYYLYNTKEDIDKLIFGLEKALKILR